MKWLSNDWSIRVHKRGCFPFLKGKLVQHFKIALLFRKKQKVRTRKDILLKIGLGEKEASTRGYYSKAFQTLLVNEVIYYDKQKKQYQAGKGYIQYMEYCANFMMDRGLDKKHKKLFTSIVREYSKLLQ